jgi:carboxylesterase type B
VWSPSNSTTTSKLPVWVFIQGGGYNTLSHPNYNGTGVVAGSNNNIVFVNFNYRVGAFGFLASEKVRENGDLNAGFLDQRKVLEWVAKYIHLVSSGFFFLFVFFSCLETQG